MMYEEFYERTKIHVTMEEYRFIEESYCDSPLDKDGFCKAWVKDYKDGHWCTERGLRQALADANKDLGEKQAELEDHNQVIAQMLDEEAEYKRQVEDFGTRYLEQRERANKAEGQLYEREKELSDAQSNYEDMKEQAVSAGTLYLEQMNRADRAEKELADAQQEILKLKAMLFDYMIKA